MTPATPVRAAPTGRPPAPPVQPPRGGSRRGLLLPAAVVWALTAVLTIGPGAAPWVAAAAVPVAAAALVLRARVREVRRRAALLAAVGAVLAAVAAASVQMHAADRHPPGLPTGTPLRLVLAVERVSPIAANGHGGALAERYLLRGTLVAAEVGHARRALSSPVLAFPDRVPAAARTPGTRVTITGELHETDPTDSAAYVVTAVHGLRVTGAPGPLDAAAARMRAVLVRHATRLPGDGGALLPGLAIGDTTAVTRSLDAAMKASSLTHLTAVSGANCAVITAAVFVIAGLLRLPRVLRVTAAAAALTGFVVLVTPQPSVLRAAAMALLVLACLASGRPVGGLPALSIAVLVLLLGDPWLARDPGFVLSVLATGGLLLLTRPIADRLARVLPERLALLLAVPVAAQVACQPVLVLLQPAVPVFGVAANLLAEPAAPLATVLGLLACLLLPVVPPLGAGLALLAWVPAAWIAAVARTCAGLPTVPWLAGAAGAVLALALLAAVVAAVHRGAPRRLRAAGVVTTLLLATGCVGGLGGGAVARAVTRPGDWEIAACDVGQGDGLVLNGGGGHYALVDTGREPQPAASCLGELGIGHVDLMVLTHYDADHVGAARSLAGRVADAFVGPSDGAAADGLRHDLVAAGVRVQQVHRGESTRVGRLRLDVLWPPDPLNGVEAGNPASITLLVTGSLRSIFTGDLGEQAQDTLLAAGPVPPVDVVKVAHHGSADQSPTFYRSLGARVGLVSCGLGNDYHHPTSRALRILAGTGTQPVRTDQSGLILVSARPGGGVAVWTERPVTAAVWTPAK